jgi:ABC-2 type transport system ATP-binding protein
LVRQFIAELSGEGRTIFLTTHNLDEAERLCDRVALFNHHLRVVDTPTNLRQQLYGRQVVVHLDQPAERLVAAIAALPYAKEVQAVDNKLVVTMDNPEADNPALIRALVGENAGIQFVGELRRSLEDVYLQLVND